MEETLTFTRVIENINYVYGEKLIKALFLLVLLEIVALVFIKKKKPELLSMLRIIVILLAFIVSGVLAYRAKPYVAYDKLVRSDTTCAAKYIAEKKDYEKFDWVDINIYKYHYYEHYNDELVSNDFDTKYGSDTDQPEFVSNVLCKDDAGGYTRQILATFLLFSTGFFFVKTILKEKNTVFSAFLSVPVSAGVLVAVTLLLQMIHIKYQRVSVIACFILVWTWIIVALKQSKFRIDKSVYISLLISLAIIVLLVFLRLYQFGGDSRWQLVFAMNLIDEGYFSRWTFAQVTTFGYYGISLHAFALLFGIDYLYAFYMLMNIAGIGIYFSAIALFSGEDFKIRNILIATFGLLVLLINYDFEFYGISLLSNSSMGVYLLSIVVLTILAMEKKEDVSILLAIMSLVLLTTRVEGVCYVLLLMSVPSKREDELKRATVISGTEIIIWQIMQYIYSDGTGTDGWTPAMGIVLIAMGIVLFCEPQIAKLKILEKFIAKYKLIYIVLLLIIVGIGFIYNPEMVKDNTSIFLSHLAVSKYSNSLSLWAYIMLLVPLGVEATSEDENSVLFLSLAYFTMIFGISIFRTGNPLNTELSDSFRRLICQMMPMCTWLISYYLGKNEERFICRK